MPSVKQKYVRSKLNSGQLEVLELVYKYRFVSRQLLAKSLKVKPQNGLYEKLDILEKHGYLGKRYDSSYKLKGMPAAYSLTPNGLRALQQLLAYQKVDDNLIKSSYKDKTVTTNFITNQLTIYSVSLDLKRLYPDIKFFTKRDLYKDHHFPKLLPDAFVSLKVEGQQKPYRYFLDVIPDNTHRYAIENKVEAYCEFFEEGSWEGTNSALPAILLLTESGSFERRLQRIIDRKLYSLDSEYLQYFSSTLSSLNNSQTTSNEIWTDVEDSDQPCNLQSIHYINA